MVPVGWLAADFVRANGYTPDSVGWGDENVEFYHRLEHVGREVKGWHRTPECRQAVSANVEWPEMSDEEALSWSQRYFGHKASGPWFVPYRSDCRSFERYDKSSDFLAPSQQERDHALWHRVRVLPRVHRAERVEPRQGRCAVQSTWGRVLWIKYQTLDGLTRLARTGSCSGLPVVQLAPGHLWGMRADRLLYRVGSPARRIGDDQMAVLELRHRGEHFRVPRQTIDIDLHDPEIRYGGGKTRIHHRGEMAVEIVLRDVDLERLGGGLRSSSPAIPRSIPHR